MPPNSKAGRSAYGAAMMRALEWFLPTDQRLFDDAVIFDFLPWPGRALLRSEWVRRQVAALMDRGAPGIRGAMLCRTRFIDYTVRRAVAQGLPAVVLLGAGLDTRPYRLPELQTVKVVEMDLPTVQAFKKAQVERCFGAAPRHVRFISTDFASEPLGVALLRGEISADDPALFVWEGVSQYLQPDAVDRTLRAIAARPPRTELVFTYILNEVVTGQFREDRSEAFRKAASRRPEPWHFGVCPSDLGRFLDVRGLRLLEDVGSPDYSTRYPQSQSRDLSVSEIERVARAVVPSDRSPRAIDAGQQVAVAG